eukprot:TRINITY_DN4099_c0_g1_i2.p1 TRINITY_DN4099_c0_g1~~TRINITY_DN4099_c0_g1_i2.p1  ORF type:complete len:111 (-),score=28.22 TRINITY_DN4099_c0_g1_i2:38-370(-)
MRIYINREDIDFDFAHANPPVQEWELSEDSRQGELEYLTKFAKFSAVYNLTLHFDQTYGADVTTLFYIGLKGETTNTPIKQIVMNTVYELAPNVKDHKVQETQNAAINPY